MTRWRLPIVALALVAVLGSCSAPPVRGGIRVMTWNVETIEHDPGEWAPVIAAASPDVVALQEICVREAFALAELLRRDHGLAYTVVPGPIVPPGPAEAHAPVNAALGRVCGTTPDAVEFGLAVLSRRPTSSPHVTTYPPDQRDEQRGYLTVRVGADLTVVDTHIGLNGVGGEQIRRLADAVPPGPVVVMGDLNAWGSASELAPLRRSLTEVDPDGLHPTTPEGKIDYIFARTGTTFGAPRTPLTTASDHLPLVADVGVGR